MKVTALELLGTDYDSKATILASDSKPVGMVTWQLTAEQLERFSDRVRAAAGPLPVHAFVPPVPAAPVTQEAIDREVAACRDTVRRMPASRPNMAGIVVALADQVATLQAQLADAWAEGWW